MIWLQNGHFKVFRSFQTSSANEGRRNTSFGAILIITISIPVILVIAIARIVTIAIITVAVAIIAIAVSIAIITVAVSIAIAVPIPIPIAITVPIAVAVSIAITRHTQFLSNMAYPQLTGLTIQGKQFPKTGTRLKCCHQLIKGTPFSCEMAYSLTSTPKPMPSS